MTIDPVVLSLILFAALLHAAWNTIVKSGRDGLLMFALIKVPTMIVSAIVIASTGIPSMASVPYALGSAVGFTAYAFLLIWAYRVGEFNLVYPVARGSAPLWVALLSSLFLGESLSTQGLLGVLIISCGIAVFAYNPMTVSRNIFDLLRAISVGLCIASYTLLDGAGARVSGNALAYAAMASLFSGIPLLAITVAMRGKDLVVALKSDWQAGMLGGIMMFSTYAIVIYAMTLTQVTHVAALRETSVIFAAAIGMFLLKERFGQKRVIAASVVAVGIILMALPEL